MWTVGIDPGKTGGVVVLRQGAVDKMRPMMPIWDFVDFMREFQGGGPLVHVFLEKAQVMAKGKPINPVSMFNYGDGYGQLQGVLWALGIPFTLVPPAVWTKDMLLGVPANLEGKQRAAHAAHRLCPTERFLPPGSKASKPHDGLVDAFLIALWGWGRTSRAAS